MNNNKSDEKELKNIKGEVQGAGSKGLRKLLSKF